MKATCPKCKAVIVVYAPRPSPVVVTPPQADAPSAPRAAAEPVSAPRPAPVAAPRVEPVSAPRVAAAPAPAPAPTAGLRVGVARPAAPPVAAPEEWDDEPTRPAALPPSLTAGRAPVNLAAPVVAPLPPAPAPVPVVSAPAPAPVVAAPAPAPVVAAPAPAPVVAAPVAPPPAPAPAPVAAAPAPVAPVSALPLVAPAIPVPAAISASEAARRAPTLDFKRVGVLSWRAKTRAGRFHDFGDIRTLRGLLDDAKVTVADSISVDGRAWAIIGDIPNLDIFFVDTWERLNIARGGAPTPPSPEPTPRPAAAPAPVRVDPPRPPEPVRPTPRAIEVDAPVPRPAARQPRRGEGPVVAALVVVAFVVGAGSMYLYATRTAEPKTAPTAPVAAQPVAPVAGAPAEGSPSAPPTKGVVSTVYTDASTRGRAPSAASSRSAPSAAGGASAPVASPPPPPSTGTATPPPVPTAAVAPSSDPGEAAKQRARSLKAPGAPAELIEATKLTPTGPAPGEGPEVYGEDGPPPPSDIVFIEEIPPDQVEKVLRAEGLLPAKEDK